MTVKTEGFHAGHFMISEANGHRSRAIVTIASGENLRAGTVLARNSVTGEYVAYDNDDTTTEDDAAAILWDNVDASDGAKEATAIVRDAEVNGDELQWGDNEDTGDREAAVTDLAAVGIICRFENKDDVFDTND